jgi:hypothetical protein
MNAKPEPGTSGTGTSTRRGRKRVANVVGRASGAVDLGVATAGTLFSHLSGAARATRDRARATTSALQLLPDTTLQGLAASSIGLGTGFYLAGLPRLVTATAVTPAMIFGAAIVLRPRKPDAGSGTVM